MRDPNDLGPETLCKVSEDRMHCNCWYDGQECHACGDPAVLGDQEE